MPTIVAPRKRHATRVCTKDPARRCRAWPDVDVGRIIEALGVSSDAQEVDEMDTRSRRLITVVASMLAVALMVTACAAPPGRGVGSQPASIVLSLANGNHDHDPAEAVRGRRRGGDGRNGDDRIQGRCPCGRAGVREGHHRRRRSRDVRPRLGRARPWHAKGVTTFDALMAPFLVDSYALQQAVLESDLERDMLAGLDGTGLVGLGVLPGPLRRVAMAEGGFRASGDLRGKLVGIGDSKIAAMTFEALGATTKTLPSGAVLGGEDAVEQQLGSVVGNRYHKDLPHVTVDLALWPRPVILFANKARFDSALRRAADGAARRGEATRALDHRSGGIRGRVGVGHAVRRQRGPRRGRR